jgi:uncharacterized protein (TIGR03437 family)
MGVMVRRLLRAALVPVGFATLLHAAPMLRLVTTAVVPVPLPLGANGGTQTVEAYNAGDGSLSLSGNPVPSVSWIATSYGSPRTCTTTTASSSCIPLQLTLNTSTLAAGTYTAVVTVNGAANVVDAPQTITVTVRIGGLTVYVAPGSSSDVAFTTNGPLSGVATTQDGNRWLSLDGTGSFRFIYPWSVHIAPPASMASGTYNGSLVTSGSSFAPDNQTIPVTMHITTQPIAQPYPDNVLPAAYEGGWPARLAQGAPQLAAQAGHYIALNNLGQGSLAVGTPTATGGSWLTAAPSSGGAAVALNPGTLAPGFYSGSVSIPSNAANGAVNVPVSFQVVAQSAPTANYGGVVDNAIFGVDGGPVTPGDIVDVFGEQFLFADATAYSPGVPLATQITASGSTSSVTVNGVAAPMYFSNYDQIAFQVPLGTATGTALVQVERDGLPGNTVSVQVAARAPRILVIVNPDTTVPTAANPAAVGNTVIIYAIGLGPTNPAVVTGAPAPSSPLAKLTTTPTVDFGSGFFGTTAVTPSYSGMSPGSVGLYQVNVVIPPGLPAGLINVSLVFPDSVSNTVQLAVQ